MHHDIYRQRTEGTNLPNSTSACFSGTSGWVRGSGAYHCPISVLQHRLAIKADIDPGHEVTENEYDDARVVDTAPEIRISRRVVHEGMIESREAETDGSTAQMERDDQIIPRGRLGIVPRERLIDETLADDCKDGRKQVAIYIRGLIVEVGPARETGLDVVNDGAVSMADAVVVLVPGRDFVIGEKARVDLVLRLESGRRRGVSVCCCHRNAKHSTFFRLESESGQLYLV